jgi:3-phosphoshikimate 1-carboxyvinyltransferase
MTQKLGQGQNLDWPPERDWSAAFVFLAAVGLRGMGIELMGLSGQSIQGDAASMKWGPDLHFRVSGIDGGLRVEPTHSPIASVAADPAPPLSAWDVDFKGLPDLAMPAIVAAALQGRSGLASGLLTLNLKESPRLDATVYLLRALGCIAEQGPDWLRWSSPARASSQSDQANGSVVQRLELDCLDDHRMAFCAGLIALRRPVRLRQSAAVSKSFPNFWKEFSVFGPDIELV